MDRLRALPGVESVGLIENVPLDEGTRPSHSAIEGMPPDGGVRIAVTYAGADYFKTMGITVLAGRPFTREDACRRSATSSSAAAPRRALARRQRRRPQDSGRQR
jgi:hypothetical protein